MSRPADAVTLAPALPGRYYSDPAVLDAELDSIFYRSWLYVCRAERLAVAGDFLTLDVGRENIIVTRGRDDRLRAFYNVCRHRGSRLCTEAEGRFAGTVQCPYHAWTYGLDGRLVGAPNLKDTPGFAKEDFGLYPVGLEIWRGCVFVNLDAGRTPLADALGGMPERTARYPLERLKVAHTTTHDVEANWKILVENYHECYHCPGVHPELCDIVPLYRRGEVDPSGGELKAWFRDGASSFTRGGVTRRPHFQGLNEEETRLYNGEMILPAAWINFLPDFIQIRSLWPLSPTRTRLHAEWLFEPETMARPDFDPADALEFTQLIADQDWKVCEGVQQGIASRAHQRGVLVPDELSLLEFDRWVLDRLERRSNA